MNISQKIETSVTVSEQDMANAIRFLAMDAVQKANSGHPGMPMGMADAVSVLFNRFVKIDPSMPYWPDRDRFVLSAGHGSMLLYAIHHLIGFTDMPMSELAAFRQMGSKTAGHPEYGHALGVETTTGPLGQGIATAVGMAIAEQMMAARFGSSLCDHFTYVVAGDGCLQEGISHEAIDLAGHLKLRKMIVLWDDNHISIDGATKLSTSMNQLARFRAAGWDAQAVDGHDPDAVAKAIDRARKSRKPSLIACRTKIGKGAASMEGSHKTHGAALGDKEIAATREKLGWPHPPFFVPEEIKSAWENVALRGQAVRKAWELRRDTSRSRKRYEQTIGREQGADVARRLAKFRAEHRAKATKVATRQASQMALEVINDATTLTIGGSADLTGSNLTMTSQTAPITAGNFKGRYLHYGIREHGMAAAMNGIALHGGFIPYGGTFLVFSDYARGAIRLSALMGLPVVYVLTHDSIGLGEDGPTHQPVEHLAMLRATPNLNVFRPADIIETAECWEIALTEKATPSVLALSRQALPMLRTAQGEENLSIRGAYVLRETKGPRDVTLLATGSEVEIAIAAADTLRREKGIEAAVVSMPCWEKFEAQDETYREQTLGSAPRIAIEAAGRLGWDRWMGARGSFIGMRGFGASAPAGELYKHFGITAEHAAAEALRLIGHDTGGRRR
ncbi:MULTISPECIES: transketolase [Alphaproteobacteria]|uniref:Transketolase n=2 Tax=Alphaproteobacteria TaxID=28211 RepID=A0A512HPF9_9HYPH|nr:MULTISPECIES: transketolase [Alphaproteobacteria]GEO87270.1 transketolase [Ciceribacter naphthalenivorans]GLR23740.1 transketolase [Ciceribacter naphthalenivorans]GLT06596.1 transketolase [Sphingomonas psychrolutea]